MTLRNAQKLLLQFSKMGFKIIIMSWPSALGSSIILDRISHLIRTFHVLYHHSRVWAKNLKPSTCGSISGMLWPMAVWNNSRRVVNPHYWDEDGEGEGIALTSPALSLPVPSLPLYPGMTGLQRCHSQSVCAGTTEPQLHPFGRVSNSDQVFDRACDFNHSKSNRPLKITKLIPYINTKVSINSLLPMTIIQLFQRQITSQSSNG